MHNPLINKEQLLSLENPGDAVGFIKLPENWLLLIQISCRFGNFDNHVGIGPDRRFCCILKLHSKFVAETVDGKLVNMLEAMLNICRLGWNILEGTAPENELPPIPSIPKLLNPWNALSGITPDKAFWFRTRKLRYCSCWKFSVNVLPLKPLFDQSIDVIGW